MKKITLLFAITLAINSWSQQYQKMISNGTHTVQEIQTKAEAHFDIAGRGRGTGYKQFKRWEYKALRTMDESGMLKTPDFYYNELQNYNNYVNQNLESRAAAATGNWEELGPKTWNDAASNGWNPGVGRVTSIAVDLGNSNHIIIGANTGGVWKTTDGGNNWTVLTDNLSNLSVTALTMDPTNTSTYFWGSTGGVIFKSTDAGSTWSLLADTGNGNVNKILIDPTNTAKMYCSVQYGGIYKSTDSGANWTVINSSATTGYDVEFKPGDTNIIYATGDEFYKSTDGGGSFTNPHSSLSSWTQENVVGTRNWTNDNSNQNGSVSPKTGASMALFFYADYSHPVTRLVSPELNILGSTTPQLKFSYTNVDWGASFLNELRVLYKTSVGDSWTEIGSYTSAVNTWADVTLSLPSATSTYYIAFEATNNYGRGITLDDVSVEDITLGTIFQDGFELGPNSFSGGAKMMGVSADDSSVIYVLEEDGGAFGGFFKSIDEGATFTKLNHAGKNYFGYSSAADDDSGQAPRDMDVAVNPTDVNEVHIAGVNTWRSSDGGANFNITSQWTPGNAAGQNIGYCHADVDILEFIGSTLYVGSDGGIFLAENTTTVSSNYYRDITSGLGIRQFYKIGVSHSDPEIVTGGAQDNGTSVYDTTANWKDWLGADGMESFVDKDDNTILYGTSQSGSLYKSTNTGTSYFGLSEPDGKSGNWITPFEQDPLITNTIYSGYDQVYKSTNGGTSWNAISQVFSGNLNHLKIAPSNSNTMYASRGADMFRTTDGGLTNWATLTGFSGSVNSIAIHPTDPTRVAIATTGANKVYVSTDSGDTWSSYLFDLPSFSALALVWENNGKNGLYLGMNYGVYYMDNTTPTNWLPFSNNLPNVEISEFEINTANNKIYAGTYGRGVWKSDLYDTAVLSTDDFELKTITVYPNPATKLLNLSWNKSDEVSIKMFNSIGKLVFFAKGVSLLESMQIDVNSFATGMYFVKINTANGVTTKKVMIN